MSSTLSVCLQIVQLVLFTGGFVYLMWRGWRRSRNLPLTPTLTPREEPREHPEGPSSLFVSPEEVAERREQVLAMDFSVTQRTREAVLRGYLRRPDALRRALISMTALHQRIAFLDECLSLPGLRASDVELLVSLRQDLTEGPPFLRFSGLSHEERRSHLLTYLRNQPFSLVQRDLISLGNFRQQLVFIDEFLAIPGLVPLETEAFSRLRRTMTGENRSGRTLSEAEVNDHISFALDEEWLSALTYPLSEDTRAFIIRVIQAGRQRGVDTCRIWEALHRTEPVTPAQSPTIPTAWEHLLKEDDHE